MAASAAAVFIPQPYGRWLAVPFSSPCRWGSAVSSAGRACVRESGPCAAPSSRPASAPSGYAAVGWRGRRLARFPQCRPVRCPCPCNCGSGGKYGRLRPTPLVPRVAARCRRVSAVSAGARSQAGRVPRCTGRASAGAWQRRCAGTRRGCQRSVSVPYVP